MVNYSFEGYDVVLDPNKATHVFEPSIGIRKLPCAYPRSMHLRWLVRNPETDAAILNEAYDAMRDLIENRTEFIDGDFDWIRRVIDRLEGRPAHG